MDNQLAGALQQLEGELARSNATIVQLMSSGIGPQLVEGTLRDLSLSPTAEVVTWFGWHDGIDGTGISSFAMELVPGAEFYDLQYLHDEYIEMRRIASDLSGRPGYPFDAAELWRPSWLPLLRLFGKGYLAVDLGRREDTSPVHIVWFDSDPASRGRVAWPTIGSFIDTAISRFEDGTYSVNVEGLVEGPTIDNPQGSAESHT